MSLPIRLSRRAAWFALACCFTSCGGGDDAGAGRTLGILAPAETMGLRPAEGAISLGPDAWVNERDKARLGWEWEGDIVEVVPGTGSVRTKQKFGDCQLHLEFMVSADPGKEWKNDGNTGVYLQRRYQKQR